MARPYPSTAQLPKGRLTIEEKASGIYIACYTPPAEALPPHTGSPEENTRPIFGLDNNTGMLTIYPYQVWGTRPMEAKYYTLESISIELEWHDTTFIPDEETAGEFLSYYLPAAMTEDYHYGLGFKKIYKPIIDFWEPVGIKSILISGSKPTSTNPDKKQVVIRREHLGQMVKIIDNINQRAQKAAMSVKREALADAFGQFLSNQAVDEKSKKSTGDLAAMIKKPARSASATTQEQKDAIDTVQQNSRRIMQSQPGALLKLREDIELVTLEQLVNKYEAMLGKELRESHWQKLFNENPFILHMALGVPAIKVHGQASVGGLKLSGSGNKIADFLVKNSISNNAAIVEIKTPATKLLSPKQYREGIFSPSAELSGAINQALDQVYMFQKEVNSLKANSGNYNIESYAVIGILIIGSSPTGRDEHKSFELFRGNSKNIQVITFDELLEKLKGLHAFLSAGRKTQDELAAAVNEDDDLPF